jgi:hypothetical protein
MNTVSLHEIYPPANQRCCAFFQYFKALALLSFSSTASKILSLLGLIEKYSSPLGKVPARTPCGDSSNTSKYLNLFDSAHSQCDNSLFNNSLSLQTLRLFSASTHFARLLCLTCTSARMRTMLSLLSFQRRTLTAVNAHLADNFTALLAGKLLLRQRNN